MGIMIISYREVPDNQKRNISTTVLSVQKLNTFKIINEHHNDKMFNKSLFSTSLKAHLDQSSSVPCLKSVSFSQNALLRHPCQNVSYCVKFPLVIFTQRLNSGASSTSSHTSTTCSLKHWMTWVSLVMLPIKPFIHCLFVVALIPAVFQVLYSSRSFVACAPTGSGKTVLFELAIIRVLMETTEPWHDVKAVYSGSR